MLQEAVDALFDNGRRGKTITGPEQAPAQVAVATCSRASRGASARTSSASASTTRADRSSSSARRCKPAPVRAAEEDGARALQAVHLQQARRARLRQHHQVCEEDGGEGAPGGLGHPRGGHQRAPGAPEPRADASPPRHPGVRAGAHRGESHPASPARLRGLQRRLRRRPDGRPRAAVGRGADGSARAHDEHEQHSLAGERQANHQPDAGHRPRALLRDARAQVREGQLPRGHASRSTRRGTQRAICAASTRRPKRCAWRTTTSEVTLHTGIRVRVDRPGRPGIAPHRQHDGRSHASSPRSSRGARRSISSTRRSTRRRSRPSSTPATASTRTRRPCSSPTVSARSASSTRRAPASQSAWITW